MLAALALIFAVITTESYDADFVKALRELRLYRLGESYVSQKLNQDDLSDKDASELTAALIELEGEHGLRLSKDEQAANRTKTRQIADAYINAHSDSPRRVWVLLALAINSVNAGELGAMNAQLRPGDDVARQDAITDLRVAAVELAALRRLLSSPQNALDPNTKEKVFSDGLWTRLNNQTSYLSARRALAMARLYPAGSPEYSDCVLQAETELKKLGTVPSTEALCWQARLLRVRCARMLGDFNSAKQALDFMLERQTPPAEFLLDLQAEKLYVLMAIDRPRALETLAELERTVGDSFSKSDPSDDAAHKAVLDAYLDLGKEAGARGAAPERKTYQDKALQWAEKMRRYDAGFYACSAQQVLAAIGMAQIASSNQDGSATAETIALAADNLFRNGQYDQAIDAYLKAAEMEKARSNQNEAFRYEYTAAATAHKFSDSVKAAALFRRAALDCPDEIQAAKAYKAALVHAGKVLDQNNPESVQEYIRWLEEFLKLYPSSPDAGRIEQTLKRLIQAVKEAPKSPARRLADARKALTENRVEEAKAEFEVLAKEFPNFADVQIGYAQCLSASNDFSAALNQWRKVAQNSKEYSPQWLQAKYEVASALIKTGQKDKAVEMIKLLKLLRPDLGAEEWSEKFEKLLLN